MIYTINYSLAIQSPGVTHHLPNYFLTLDGDKFSTSRKHAIWVEDLSDEISIDILRLYLLKINVDESPNDFNTNDFINFYNSTSSRLTQILGAQEYSLNSGLSAEEIEKLFQITRSELYTITMPENYSATRIYNTLSSFLGCNPLNAEAHANWLKFFAILFYPVMPELTQHVWQTQGFDGFPVYSMSPNPPKSLNAINIIFPVISQAHLN